MTRRISNPKFESQIRGWSTWDKWDRDRGISILDWTGWDWDMWVFRFGGTGWDSDKVTVQLNQSTCRKVGLQGRAIFGLLPTPTPP